MHSLYKKPCKYFGATISFWVTFYLDKKAANFRAYPDLSRLEPPALDEFDKYAQSPCTCSLRHDPKISLNKSPHRNHESQGMISYLQRSPYKSDEFEIPHLLHTAPQGSIVLNAHTEYYPVLHLRCPGPTSSPLSAEIMPLVSFLRCGSKTGRSTYHHIALLQGGEQRSVQPRRVGCNVWRLGRILL